VVSEYEKKQLKAAVNPLVWDQKSLLCFPRFLGVSLVEVLMPRNEKSEFTNFFSSRFNIKGATGLGIGFWLRGVQP